MSGVGLTLRSVCVGGEEGGLYGIYVILSHRDSFISATPNQSGPTSGRLGVWSFLNASVGSIETLTLDW